MHYTAARNKAIQKIFYYTISGPNQFFFPLPVLEILIDGYETCALVSVQCSLTFSLSLCSTEVQIKVQVFDNSDLSPLADAQVNVHGNQTILASDRAGSDGTVRVSFLYRTGTRVIITASKQDYVTNSVPWHSSRIPCKSLVVINSHQIH